MSDTNKTPSEQELWDVLTDPAAPAASAAPVKEAPPARRKLDGFFFACMAGVAAVSVAATLILGGLSGDKSPAGEQVPGPVETNPPAVTESVSDALHALEQENELLREQVRLQKQKIKDLQAQILDLTGSASNLPDTTDPQQDEQVEAYEIFNQIQEAYADFDREKLEELIPEMDKRINLLSKEAMYEYYQILEYVEMPSNG